MASEGIRITTWNVNGIRNPFNYQPWREKRTLPAMFDALGADIVIMQELKIQRKDLRDDMVLLDGWDCFFSLPKHKKGYSGVGVYTRLSKCAPIRAEEGILGALCPPGSTTPYCDLPKDQSIGGYPSVEQILDIDVDPVLLDSEGRCVVIEFPAFVLLGVYSPANSNGMRDDFRFGFIKALDARIRNLSSLGKRVILTGDLNVSRDERDSAGAEDDIKKLGISHEDYISTPNRRIFNQLIDGGEVILPRDDIREKPILSDLCREFHPDRKGMYTHWEQKINARPGNYGSRIDYVLCSIGMRDWFSDANIQEGLLGSDHCPVYAILKSHLPLDGKDVPIQEMMKLNTTGDAGSPEITKSTILPLSGRLLPEFDKRRNILEMFKKPKPVVDVRIPLEQSIKSSENRSGDAEIEPPSKRQRTAPSPKRKTEPARNQSGIKNFFLPKSNSSAEKSVGLIKPHSGNIDPLQIDTDTSQESKLTSQDSILSKADKRAWRVDSEVSQVSQENEPDEDTADFVEDLSLRIAEAEASKTEWTKIFSRRDAPRCEGHSEPCQCLETKKKGVNFGRKFWICARPVGPTGTKENGTQWRCKTFIWASDVGREN